MRQAAVVTGLLLLAAGAAAAPASARVIEIFPPSDTTSCNEEFENVANTLQPGDELVLHDGVYSQACARVIARNGTAASPIVIRAASGARPIITRPMNANFDFDQNNVDITNSSYLVIRGLTFRGGDIGVTFRGTSHHITFEDNEVFETGNNAIALNSGNSDAMIFRRNHIHHTGLYALGATEGEGMYVGCNNATCLVTNSLIENNYIHHTRSTSGGGNDGIEIKPGSANNIVRHNVIHDTTIGTRYPCIFLYGGGAARNTVEGNVMWNCGEAIQVVSDAVIQNNIILTSDVGITAAPHAQVNGVRNVTIVNNTLHGHDVCLSIGWSGATNAILANNAVYCPSATAVSASLGSAVVRSNYITGSGASIDNVRFFAGGSATAAFANPAGRDLWPTASSVLRNTADASFVPPRDFNETTRTASFDVGAYETEGLASNPGWQVVAGFKTVGSSPPAPPAQALTLIGAVLPSSRSVAVGQTATAFAAVINVGPDRGLTCGLQLATPIAGEFAYQTTNPQTNALIGTANTPVDIEAGSLQTFVFAVTPSAPLAPTDVALSMDCANGEPAEVQPGLNTLLLSASTTPVPDVVAMAMTLSGDGIVTATGAGADGVFSVATANVGLGATVTVTADTGSAAVPVNVQVCRTQPATGACLGAPAASVQTMLEAQGTATFGVFVRALGPIAFQPAVHRIHVRFRDGAGVIRGSTSVAVRTP